MRDLLRRSSCQSCYCAGTVWVNRRAHPIDFGEVGIFGRKFSGRNFLGESYLNLIEFRWKWRLFERAVLWQRDKTSRKMRYSKQLFDASSHKSRHQVFNSPEIIRKKPVIFFHFLRKENKPWKLQFVQVSLNNSQSWPIEAIIFATFLFFHCNGKWQEEKTNNLPHNTPNDDMHSRDIQWVFSDSAKLIAAKRQCRKVDENASRISSCIFLRMKFN